MDTKQRIIKLIENDCNLHPRCQVMCSTYNEDFASILIYRYDADFKVIIADLEPGFNAIKVLKNDDIIFTDILNEGNEKTADHERVVAALISTLIFRGN